MNLTQQNCQPCNQKTPALSLQEIQTFLNTLNDWKLNDVHHLYKEYRFNNFAEALLFVNRVGTVAEEQNHHPDIYLAWGKVRVEIWTHSIAGLSKNDFILAAKIEQTVR